MSGVPGFEEYKVFFAVFFNAFELLNKTYSITLGCLCKNSDCQFKILEILKSILEPMS